jgi:1-deoxy-D-xylulose-5-phosphate synthase
MPDNNRHMTIDMTEYPTLALVNSPADLRQFPEERLTQLCQELRTFLLHSVSRSSGHLASGLGVVELTVALHYVYQTPIDKLVWDVGHQAYPHKILTGDALFPPPSEHPASASTAADTANAANAAVKNPFIIILHSF